MLTRNRLLSERNSQTLGFVAVIKLNKAECLGISFRQILHAPQATCTLLAALVPIANADGLSLLVHDAQLQLAAVVVEVADEEWMQAFLHGMLANLLTWRVFAIVVDYHLAIKHQVAAVVGEQGEGIDAIGRYLDESREDESDVIVT